MNNKLLKVLLVFGLSTLLVAMLIWSSLIVKQESSIEFVLFDLGQPKSFDPLDGDKAINLNIMRLMYLTPIEISEDNKLKSSVLETFAYFPDKNLIVFDVKRGLFFEDGTSITVDDVLLAITRMCMERPGFPVLRDIVGISEWARSTHPLLSRPLGISVDGSRIKIELSKPQVSPLFRFTLELFSIIPASCIDLESNKLKCQIPPESGYYRISSKEEKKLVFKKRISSLNKYANQISISYRKATDGDFKKLLENKNTVLYGTDVSLKGDNLSHLKEELSFAWMPAARFRFLLLNPKVPPFDDVQCRKYFIKKYREVVSEFLKDDFTLSSSLFPSIVPGYLNDSEFLLKNEDSDDVCSPEKFGFEWYLSRSANLDFYDQVLVETMRRINPHSSFKVSTADIQDELFDQGKNPFLAAGSGFWPEDPVGDLLMFFTPNLHKPLKYVIDGTQLGQLVKELNQFSPNLKHDMEKINRAAYDEALINIFIHSRKFFASSNPELVKSLPQAVSAPSFYQVGTTK